MSIPDSLEMTPQELKRQLDEQSLVTIIDVREPQEHAVACLSGAELIPMQSVPSELQRLESLADKGPLAILCHHGVRSLNVAVWLRNQGVENCFSVAGGIDRWSAEIDSSIPRY